MHLQKNINRMKTKFTDIQETFDTIKGKTNKSSAVDK